jgi:hypothetical protein
VVAEREEMGIAPAQCERHNTGAAIEPRREKRNLFVTFEIDECGF